MNTPGPDPRRLLRTLFDTAVAAADPLQRVPAFLPAPPPGRMVVVGAGKASARMAQAVEQALPDVPLSGLVVTRYGHAVPTKHIEIVEAAHPVPDAAGERAAAGILELVSGLGPDGLVLALISGGGSALLTLPAPGLTLADKQAVNAALLDAYRVDVPTSVRSHLRTAAGCPGPDDPRMSRVTNTVIAAPQQSLEAAAGYAWEAGVTPMILGDSIEGESREVGVVLAGNARQVRRHGQPTRPPCVLLPGGETTVTVRGAGHGGPNVELLVSMALALHGEPGVHALACDTDGVDGADEIAGAIIDPSTLDRAAALGVDAAGALAGNDGHSFFAALGDQVITGPTLTNVNDFRAVLIT